MNFIRSMFPNKRHWLGGFSILALAILLPNIVGCAKKPDVPPRSAGYYNVKLKQPIKTNN